MSIKKVADIAGVSIATVSRYFNNPKLVKKETQDKVENAIKLINYQPNILAQNFRRGKSGLIIVVVHCIGDPLYRNLTHRITQTAHVRGYAILIKEATHNSLPLAHYQHILKSKQADGLIMLVDLPETDHEEQIAQQSLPIVLIKSEELATDKPSPNIGLDNSKAGETATNHLIHLGHKNIACITREDKHTAYLKRQAGFINAMKRAQLPHKNHLFILPPCGGMETTVSHILTLTPRPTAIFCTDDDTAIDALYIAKQKGLKIPLDLSIIGFNNIHYSAKTDPPLTTVEQPIENIAQHSIEILCAKIEGKEYPLPQQKKSFEHQLIIRSSTCHSPSQES